MSKETKQKVAGAFRVMKDLGISIDKVKPVLKKLLKLYDKNWELIEAENYRVLADAIFESEEAESSGHAEKVANNEAAENSWKNADEKSDYLEEDAQATEEPERPLKRLRLRYQEGPTPPINNSIVLRTPLIVPKEEPDILPEDQPLNLNRLQGTVDASQPQTGMSMSPSKNKGKLPISLKSPMVHESSSPIHPHDSHVNLKSTPLRVESRSPSHSMQLTDEAKYGVSQVPERLTFSGNSMVAAHLKEPNVEPNSGHLQKRKTNSSRALIAINPSENDSTNGASPPEEPAKNGNHAMIADICSSNIEIASSSCGGVKILLNCHLALGKPDFHMPSLEDVLKSVQDKCLRSHKTFDPKFSVRNLMQEMCECVLKLGTESSNESSEVTNMTLASDLLKNSSRIINSQFDDGLFLPKPLLLPPPFDGLGEGLQLSEMDPGEDHLPKPLLLPPPCDDLGDGLQLIEMGCGEEHVTNENFLENGIEVAYSSIMVVEQCLSMNEMIRPHHDVIDITKGQEKLAIRLVNYINNECPPSFCYITQNAVFQNAHVNFALARIGDNKCCSTCCGDCLSFSKPCACGLEGGDFVYTSDGLAKEAFLDECISMSRDPKNHCHTFCKSCPVQNSKIQDVTEHCKGHLVRKFIKECWWKCGCNKQCGNRVVQRGISYHLQVFMTAEGKGWGLRTLEDLPKGVFVCEYVGEILTNSEFFDRVSRSHHGMEHSHPILLDADWGSKGVLKDEEALFLDASCYGNVARFINHRCYDSNLVEIPVEVETPDRHYYHVALFTTREVKALEELTRDYGIDFDDKNPPVEAFRCLCGSKFCRNINLTGI